MQAFSWQIPVWLSVRCAAQKPPPTARLHSEWTVQSPNLVCYLILLVSHHSISSVSYGMLSLYWWGQSSFRSVVVITLASHARGPGFETQRKQPFISQQVRGWVLTATQTKTQDTCCFCFKCGEVSSKHPSHLCRMNLKLIQKDKKKWQLFDSNWFLC